MKVTTPRKEGSLSCLTRDININDDKTRGVLQNIFFVFNDVCDSIKVSLKTY